jgi:hypothetical protein
VQQPTFWFLHTHLFNSQIPPFFKSLMFSDDENSNSFPTSNSNGEPKYFSLFEDCEPKCFSLLEDENS